MSQRITSAAGRHSKRAGGAPGFPAPQLQAYLLARETMRRLKLSATPCFARDWRPKLARGPGDQDGAPTGMG